MLKKAFLFLFLLAGTTLAEPIHMLDSLDRACLDSAMGLLRLTRPELGFDKLWAEDDTFRLAVVEKYLGDPLAFPGYVDETALMVDSLILQPKEMLLWMGRQLQVDPEAKPLQPPEFVPPAYDPGAPFKLWISALEAADPLRRKYLAGLDSLDIHDLLMTAPTLWCEADDSLKKDIVGCWQREFGIEPDTSRKVDSDRVLDIMKKLDVNSLLQAAMIVVPAAQATARGAASDGCKLEPWRGETPGVSGEVLYYRKTPWGTMVIGGRGDNVYKGDFAAIIDLGGNDVYRGRCGGALGVLDNSYSLLIDMEGDDYYAGEGVDVTQGAGFLGIGVLIDRSGADVYRSGGYSQGAGYFGVGVLADHGGADDRRGKYFMQGAGHCGVGMLIDDGDMTSDDRYNATTWAQGFASTYGYGLLFDSGGDDVYRTGGAYYHEPLLPHDYRSFSGGFGMGWRPRAGGGVAVLSDKGDGNDFYDAEVMSFGSSYWYSIGILIEGGGNDHYSLAHYGLGAGIHLSLGGLYDVSGDDQYRSRWGVVGGTPHDLSVGMMVDGSGDDFYIVSDGWGGSLTNSVSLFIDRLGNDTYATRGGVSFGDARWARGFGGIGFFLDEEGNDVYPRDHIARDSTTWIMSGWGIGMDLPRDIIASEKEEEVGEITLTAEDSAKTIEDLYGEASQWEVGSARKSVARARKALLTKGADVVRYILDNKLDTRNSLESRLQEQVVQAMPDSAGPLLIAKLPELLDLKDNYPLKTTVSLLGSIKWKAAVDPLLDILDKKSIEKSRNVVIATLGQLGDKKAAGRIAKYISDDKERRRLVTVGALAALKDSTTIEALVRSLDDPMFTIRSAAMVSVPIFGAQALPPLKAALANPKTKYPEAALYAVGRMARDLKDSSDVASKKLKFELVGMLTPYLDDPNPQLRSEAVGALYRVGLTTSKELVDRMMEAEYHPVPLAAWQRVKKESEQVSK
ncbi:MAG: HEAT repeat domain-containing protein [Calditrichota bacterium]